MGSLRALMGGRLKNSTRGLLAVLVAPAVSLAAGLLKACTGPTRIGAERSTGQTRLQALEDQAQLLQQENARLRKALQEREMEVGLLATRRGDEAARDRQELVRLQEELESDQRIGSEKARLIRSSEAALQRAQADFLQTRFYRARQRASMTALQAALTHAKRAQASTENRLARLREQLRHRALPAAREALGTERVIERIVEIPVETIVYRDREVPVEVPIEVPVGFTACPVAPTPPTPPTPPAPPAPPILPASPVPETPSIPPVAGGLRARYSEKGPSSA